MTLRLYFAPGACSFVPHTLLEMAGVPYEPVMVKLHKGEQNEAAFRAINPRGQVPVLADGEQRITQILAIIGYIADTQPQMRYLPAAPLARAKVMETLAWMNNTAHPAFTHIFMPHKFASDEAAKAHLKLHNTGLFAGMLGELEAMVQAKAREGREFLAAEGFGPLDAYALTLLRWGSLAGIDPQSLPATWAHVQRVAALPAVARVIERERLQLNLYKPG